MKLLLARYKYLIITYSVLLFMLLYFSPTQNGYYLRQDISAFKSGYLHPVLIWTWGVVSVLLLATLFYKTRSYKTSGLSFLIGTFYTGMILFIFQDLILAGCLFVNRLGKREMVIRQYELRATTELPLAIGRFYAFDIVTKQADMDRKVESKIFTPSLQATDTVPVTFHKGLLGIVYEPKAFAP